MILCGLMELLDVDNKADSAEAVFQELSENEKDSRDCSGNPLAVMESMRLNLMRTRDVTKFRNFQKRPEKI